MHATPQHLKVYNFIKFSDYFFLHKVRLVQNVINKHAIFFNNKLNEDFRPN